MSDATSATFDRINAGMKSAYAVYVEAARTAPADNDKLRITGRVQGYKMGLLTLDAAIYQARSSSTPVSVCALTLKYALEMSKEAIETSKKQVSAPDSAWMRPMFLGIMEGQADALRDLMILTRAIESEQVS